MKNKVIAIVLIVIIIAIGIFLILSKDNSDNTKFKNDYGEIVPKGTSIIYLTDKNIIQSLNTDDKLVFLGKKASEDTKKAVSILLKTAEDNGIDKIYYYDLKNIEKKEDIKSKLTKKIEKEELISPTLFLVKDKKVEEIQEGITKDLKTKYEDIMISYIMCNKPDC